MYSAKVYSSESLYWKIVRYLAVLCPESTIVSNFSDCRDDKVLDIVVDFGKYSVIGNIDGREVRFTIENSYSSSITERYVIISSSSAGENLDFIRLACESPPRNLVSSRYVRVQYWEEDWRIAQAVFAPDHKPSSSQQLVIDDVNSFYSATPEGLTIFQRGLIICGASNSGKRWITRQIALMHNKAIVKFKVSETSFPSLGSALSSVPLNSILVLEGLAEFYSHLPTQEKALFLRQFASFLNMTAMDSKGLLLVALLPLWTAPDLLNFMEIPNRFQRKFEISISDNNQLTDIFTCTFSFESNEGSDGTRNNYSPEELANRCRSSGVPAQTLACWAKNISKEIVMMSPQVLESLDGLCASVKEERRLIDAGSGRVGAERLYS